MARLESFTYGSFTVGGASPTIPAQIKDRFGFNETIDQDGNAYAEFATQFVVSATTSSVMAGYNQQLQEALGLYRQALTVSFGASDQLVFDPDVSSGDRLGFDATTVLRKIEEGSTALAQVYEFRAKVMLPVLLSGQDYRRTSLTSIHYDVTDLQTVTVTGNYTASPNKTSRATLLAYIDSFINTRIVSLFGGPPTTEWALTSSDEPTNDPNTVTSFSRVYSRHVGGRRSETWSVAYSAARLRLVTIRGSYIRTPGSPLSVSAASATTNYTNNQPANSAAILAALVPPLTDTDNCELISQNFTPNQQNDRLDFDETWRELNFQQSPNTGGGLNDPEIISDEVVFSRSFEPLDDSPAPTVMGGQLSFGSIPNGGLAGRIRTVPPPANPEGSNQGQGSINVQKWVTVTINYRAFVEYGVNLNQKWTNVLQPYLLGLLAERVSYAPTTGVSVVPEFDPTNSTIRATVIARSILGDLFFFQSSSSQVDDFGLRLDPAFTGKPHAYLVQQGLPRRTMQRNMAAICLAGGSFSITKFASGSAIPGWVKVQQGLPSVSQRTIGLTNVPGLGLVNLRHESMVEDFVWVESDVAGLVSSSGGDQAQQGAQNGAGGANGANGAGGDGGGIPGAGGGGGGSPGRTPAKIPGSTRATGQTSLSTGAGGAWWSG